MAKEKIDDERLQEIITREIADAKTFYSSDIEANQRRALDYYEGRMKDTPYEEGWSKVVSKDASDVIGWAIPGIVRTFTASDRIVDYQPMQMGDEEFTDQASDTINFDFKANDGYRILWDATHDALLLGDGIVKTYWDDTKEYETDVLTGMTAQQIAIMLEQSDGEIEVTEQKAGEPFEDYVEGEPVAGPDGQMVLGEPQLVQVPTFDIKIRRVTSAGRLKFKAIQRGNFFIDRDAITIQTSRFCSQRDPRITRSNLIEMGFDRDKVKAIPRYDGSPSTDTDELTRDYEATGNVMPPDESTEFIELHECYIRMDVNGDGIAERVRAYYAGNAGSGVLLEWEEYDDEVPFDQIPCTPVPHRFASESLASEVVDIQQIKTILLREGLNNSYSVNTPQTIVEEDSVKNTDELYNPSVGGVLEVKKGTVITHKIIPSILPNVIEAIGMMDRMIESRTGISRSTMALDPETLQNTSATASQLQHDAAYSQVELIARNMAELGWKMVFGKALRLTVKHQDRPRTIRLRDKWVDVDPRFWNADMDVLVNTGLGTGSRDRDQMMLANVNAQQEKIAAALEGAGLSDLSVDMLNKMIKTAIKSAEAAGLRNAGDYFLELDDDQIAAIKKRIEDQAGQPPPEIQMKMEKDKAELVLQKEKQDADAALEKYKIDTEAAIKREQMAMEERLQARQIEREAQLKALQIWGGQGGMPSMQIPANVGGAVRFGGQPG